MSSQADISNLALSHLGISAEVQDVETERSKEAAACRRFYEPSVKAVLRDFPWPFATQFVTLALVEEDPTTEWGYSYRYPADCISLRKLQSAVRVDTLDSRIPYRIARDTDGQLIYTDLADAVCEYTQYVDDPEQYPEDVAQAIALYMAWSMMPRLAAGDPQGLGQRAFQLYQWRLAVAEANAAEEEASDIPPESEFVRGRE